MNTFDVPHCAPAPVCAEPWCSERRAWRFVLLQYPAALAAFPLLWEIAQLPLYAIWSEASMGFIVYAVLHCTAGDVLIGVGSLLAALAATRSGPFEEWHWFRLGLVAVVFGVLYTAFSEWMNTVVRDSWTYSAWMPVLPVLSIGVSPLLQWVLMPLAALAAARRFARPRGKSPCLDRDSGESP